MPKVLGVSGSPRKSSTYKATEIALEACSNEDVETDIISLKEYNIKPCFHCNYCKKNDSDKSRICVIDDDMEDLYDKLISYDGFIFASPVYAMNITPQLHSFFTRFRPLHEIKGGVMRNKLAVGIAVGGTRNGGQESTLIAIANACWTRGIIYLGNEPGNYSGAMVWSKDNGEKGVVDDTTGYESLVNIGERIGKLTKIFFEGKKSIEY